MRIIDEKESSIIAAINYILIFDELFVYFLSVCYFTCINLKRNLQQLGKHLPVQFQK